MLVRNTSSKIIGINETSILPGDTQKVPEGYEKNPVVLKYIANGTFAVVKPVKSSKKDPAEGAKKADDIQGTGAEQDTDGAQGQQTGA